MDVKQVLSFIKIEHTLFSLPFVLMGYLIAIRQFGIDPGMDLLWILLAAVGARGLAMALNRIIDRDIDAANPRTQGRHLASGSMSMKTAWSLAGVFLAMLLVSAGLLNRVALMMAWLPVLTFVIYPYMKRFTHGVATSGWGCALGSLQPVLGSPLPQTFTGGGPSPACSPCVRNTCGRPPSCPSPLALRCGLPPSTSTMLAWTWRATESKASILSRRSSAKRPRPARPSNSRSYGLPALLSLTRWTVSYTHLTLPTNGCV